MVNIFDLTGKTAFVTGASSGLGIQFTHALAQAGANIIIGARRKDKLDEVAKSIEALGKTCLAVELDVTKTESIRQAINTIEQEVGCVDILVNNAGKNINHAVLEYPEKDWDDVVEANLKSVWLMSQDIAKLMLKHQRSGSIINISSALASNTRKKAPAYLAAKAGVSHLTRALALELAPYKIRVNAIAPGWFVTDLNRAMVDTDMGRAIISRIPLSRTGDPKELEGALILLASDASSYMTGTIIPVDGGVNVNQL
jgi:NAD(P)-dependent dehydrogenase (short-subunit alcohol dehydrogenase family)